MNSRERVLCALNHKQPDRVPLDLGAGKSCKFSLGAYKKVLSYFGMEEEIRFQKVMQTAFASDAFFERIESDVRAVYPAFIREGAPDPEWEDEQYFYFRDQWGTAYRKPKVDGLYFDYFEYPLEGKDEDADAAYVLPRPSYISKAAAQEAVAYRETGYPVIMTETFGSGFLHTGPKVYGFDDWFSILASEEQRAIAFLDKLLERKLEYWDKVSEVFGTSLDIVCEMDDVGMQTGPWISPTLFRRVIKPYYQKLYPYIKKVTGAKLFLHCCGSITQLLPDLIEAGVDIVSPVQINAADMDPYKLKKEFGKDICFWGGGVDTQIILPTGTPQQVKDHVKRNIDAFSTDGGFVFAAVHNIQANVPVENIIAMWESFMENRG